MTTAFSADLSNWEDAINSIQPQPKLPKTPFQTVESLKEIAEIKTLPSDIKKWFNDLNHWQADKQGQIILSDQQYQSFYFDKDGTSKIYPNDWTDNDAEDFSLYSLKTQLNTWK